MSNETINNSDATTSKSLTGYRIMIGLLVVILAAVSALYFSIHNQQKADYSLLIVERNEVQGNLTELISEYGKLETDNKKLKANMELEKLRADSIITALKKERSLNFTKLKNYEREVGTLRSVLRGYLQQIDSLNNLNQQLISENVSYKKKITSVELRAAEAEERAKELNNRILLGSRLRAEAIEILPLNTRGRTISRVKRAVRLSVNFTVASNELTTPGNKEIYARVISPDGYVLATEKVPTFNYNGEKMTYTASRKVDYQNASLPVSIFYSGQGFTAGVYTVELYHENYSIGTAKVSLR